MTEKQNIKIFVSHRNDMDSVVVKNDIFYPVVSGAADDKRPSVEIPGDNTGDNISDRAKRFNELTVQYWAWKNVKADYYGLCHYRRYMNFTDVQYPEDINCNVYCDYLDDESIHKYGLDDVEKIRNVVLQNDFLYTKQDIRKFHEQSIYGQFAKLPYLDIRDLDLALSILKKKYPEFTRAADKYLAGTIIYPCEMYIMKKDIFDFFCQWLFDILFELDEKIDTKNSSVDSRRTLGHIAERLDGVFISWLLADPSKKSQCLQRIFFQHTEKPQHLKPQNADSVPVVTDTISAEVPILSSALISMLENASPRRTYDIVVLNTDLTDLNRKLLKKDLARFKNASLRFYDVKRLLSKYSADYDVSLDESCYPFLVPEVMAEYNKVVYLNRKVIVQDDIAELYDTDLRDCMLGAVPDVMFCGEYNNCKSQTRKFFDEKLKLSDPFGYFQTDVLVIDLVKFRNALKDSSFLHDAAGQTRVRNSCDAMNLLCQGHVMLIDQVWNMQADSSDRYVSSTVRQSPVRIYESYLKAHDQPAIINITRSLPWEHADGEYADEFGFYARKSLFYEELLQRMMQNSVMSILQRLRPARPSLIRRTADKVLPLGSRRRELVKKILGR